MKIANNNIYIIALCISSIISLHAAQPNTPPAKKQTSNSNGGTQKNPEQKHSTTEQKAHPIIIHATRILPKKTMNSLHQLLKGLPAYSKNLSTQSAINPTDLQNLQTSLANFAKALGEKHPYLAEEKSQTAVKLDETAILNHIQVILKSLPWYIQNPKVLASPIDLHEFSKQLNNMHNQVKTEENKNIQAEIKTLTAKKINKSNPSSATVKTHDLHSDHDTMIQSLANPKLSEDQQDMREDSDGTPFGETLTENSHTSNNDVISQSLSKKSTKLSQVVNKRGKIIGSYQRTSKKDGNHIGQFNPLQGKTKSVIEGSSKAPKVDGVGKKAIGYVSNSSNSTKELTLYPYHKASEKKHRK